MSISTTFRMFSVSLLAFAVSCANTKGDDVTCPTCDNTTQVLSGAKCVPLAEVAACGPDGHVHGTECHCFSGQSPTPIGGASYCLQLTCGGTTAADPAAAACDEVGRAAETVNAATTLAEVDGAHVPVGKVVQVTVPAGQDAFIHFEADEPGEMHVFAATAGVVQGASTEAGVALSATNEGANEDCASILPEAWGIDVKAAGAVVVRLNAATATQVKLVVVEGSHGH